MVPIRATYLIFIYVNPYNEDISEFLTNVSTQSLSHDFSKSLKNRQGLIRNMVNTKSVNTGIALTILTTIILTRIAAITIDASITTKVEALELFLVIRL